PTLIERAGLGRFLSPPVRMILRHLERQLLRSALSVLGISLGTAVLILGSFIADAIDYAMESQFGFAQKQDLTLSFVEPVAAMQLGSLLHLPGVQSWEPLRGLPVRMSSGHRSRRLGVMGLRPDARLYQTRDIRRRHVALPPGGVVLSAKLAEVLR